ncbi:hypothetical protein YGAWVPHU_CDS0057 [Salmonella phage SeKF_13]
MALVATFFLTVGSMYISQLFRRLLASFFVSGVYQ